MLQRRAERVIHRDAEVFPERVERMLQKRASEKSLRRFVMGCEVLFASSV